MDKQQRKKPGRPRKRASGAPVSNYGIVTDPINPDDCIELVYNQPNLLKCIDSIFKEYDCDEIIMDFAHDTITLFGRDHSLLVNINVTIRAQDMNLYYFAPTQPDINTYRIIMRRDNLDIVAAIIEKTHYKVTLALRKDDLSTLIIILNNCEYGNDDRFDVSVVPRASSVNDDEVHDPERMPLEFTIDSHHLRRKISELKKVAHDLVIQKRARAINAPSASPSAASSAEDSETGDELEISFGSTPRVAYTGIYRNGSKIKLRCDIPPEVLFIATINIAHIRPLMTVNIPGGITFFIGHEEPHIVRVGLDTRADGHHAINVQLQIRTEQDQ